MPTIKQSQNVDVSKLEPAAPAAISPAAVPTPPPDTARSVYMTSPLPAIASSSDGLARQFYGGAQVPRQRILPVTEEATSAPATSSTGGVASKGDKGDPGAPGSTGPAGPSPTGSGNQVLATPADGSSAAAALRTLVAADVPALDAAKVTTGVFDAARIPNRIRRVGVTIDGAGATITTGVKGSIQVDFAGTIIGWSIEADQAGSISVEIDKKAGTQTVPAIPNTTSDKISASAPIALSSAQAAGVGASGVSTWTTSVAQWDSIQFKVASVTTIQRATLYLRIQES